MKSKLSLLTLEFGIVLFAIAMVGGCGQGQQATESPTFTGLTVYPDAVMISVGSTQQFKIGGLIKSSSSDIYPISWMIVGGVGTIDAEGLFTATNSGDGTVEARIDSVVGKARVTVTGGDIKIVSGKIRNIFSSGEAVSSAQVIAGGKIGQSGSDGSFSLAGVPMNTRVISAAAPGFFPVSILLSNEVVNIPMGYPLSAYTPTQTENTTIKGRVVDSHGNPVTSSTPEVQFTVLLENGSSFGGSSYLYSAGAFSQSIPVPKNQASTAGCIIVSYKDGATYKAAIKEISVVSGVTLEVGDIVVSEPAATLTGTVSPPSGFSVFRIEWGIMFSSSNRRYVASTWSGNSYTFHVPATPTGKEFYIKVMASRGSDTIYYYLDNLDVNSDEILTQNPVLPQGIDIIYPTSGQSDVSATPKIEWSSAKDGFAYVVLVGDAYWIKWWGLTNETSIEYPSFPVGGGGEAANLNNGKDYYVSIAGYKDLNIFDLKDAGEFSNVSTYVYYSATPFTVGSVSGSGIRSFDIRGGGEFDKKVGEFLKGIGLEK